MNPRFAKYRELRKDGLNPFGALAHLRDLEKVAELKMQTKYDRQGRPTASWEEDGFEFRASVCIDEGADLSYLGWFTHKKLPGSIKRRNVGRNECEFYLPPEKLEDERKIFHQAGHAKHEAHTMACKLQKERMKRLENAGSTWNPYNIDLTVHKFGVNLVTVSIGSYEFGCAEDKEELCLALLDLRQEALDQAKERIAELRNLLNQ